MSGTPTPPAAGRPGRPLKRRDAAYTRDTALGPSMTPMVDVVLVILIFFMASTTFLGPEWLLRSALLRPPRPADGGASAFTLPPARFELALTTDEAVARLTDYAARLGPDRLTIVVSPDSRVPYRDVIRVHEACAALGIRGVGLD
jgi:biopolymer transport protein ExbD